MVYTLYHEACSPDPTLRKYHSYGHLHAALKQHNRNNSSPTHWAFCSVTAAAGTANGNDQAEPYRMFDGYDDNGVDEDGVMTLEVGHERGAVQNTEGTADHSKIRLFFHLTNSSGRVNS